jgi:hypothetical protein
MTDYNPAISRLTMPPRMRKLSVDDRGYPVPSFVEWINGKPDFRVVKGGYLTKCVRSDLCWLCGEKLGRWLAFVIGPMCAINRTTAEPPSHRDCAQFAVKACPFLTQPNRKRNPHDLPEEGRKPAGLMITRNPGVSLIWVTTRYQLFQATGGFLFRLGDPTSLEWYAHGRAATRDEIMHSIEGGLPTLRMVAKREGHGAIADLDKQIKRGLALVPA